MNWLIKTSDNDTLDNWFRDLPSSKPVKKDPPEQEQIQLSLYRGFDADLDQLERVGDSYILSPHKSEQGVIWFSQDPNVAQGRGKWLLTYPLTVIRHIERIHYDDGSYSNGIPEEINTMCSPTENCRFYGGIELPEGWFFSYKVEKHIICSIPLKITQDMLTEMEG